MELRVGEDIHTPKGDKVGSIERVVLDPKTREVSHVVVEKGFLFTEEKVVPIDLLAPQAGNGLALREGPYTLEDLPSFAENEYVPAGVESTPSVASPAAEMQPVYWYPPVGIGWWRGIDYRTTAEPELELVTEINIPEGTIALKEGARVLSSDDEHVGDVEKVLTEPEADRASHLVISQGLLTKSKKLIPTSWVSTMLEDEVFLSVPADLVESLPDYQHPEE
ncbi:MAG: PRC-barrel domain-containing protein [Anaerolineae bacterium]|jgi:uncharacterized protein YrrD